MGAPWLIPTFQLCMGSVLSLNARVRNHRQISGVCICPRDIFLCIQRYMGGANSVKGDVPSLSWSDWMLHLHQWAMPTGELLANRLVRLPPLYPAPDCPSSLLYSLSLSKEASHVALVVKNLPASAGDGRDMGLISGLGRPPGAEHGKPLQYSCLENPMDRGAGRLPSTGPQRGRRDWSNFSTAHTCPSYIQTSGKLTTFLVTCMSIYY